MVEIGRGMGKKVAALITDMEQPLGRTVGNALEVVECIETLKGRGPKDLESLSIELAAWMLFLCEVAPNMETARARVRDALQSGAGLAKFREIVELQGGDPRVVDDYALFPHARETVPVRAERDGRVTRIACRDVGLAGMLLGAGRETVDSVIDPAVGLVLAGRLLEHLDQVRVHGQLRSHIKSTSTVSTRWAVTVMHRSHQMVFGTQRQSGSPGQRTRST
jgi:thymidine phosphorylase